MPTTVRSHRRRMVLTLTSRYLANHLLLAHILIKLQRHLRRGTMAGYRCMDWLL